MLTKLEIQFKFYEMAELNEQGESQTPALDLQKPYQALPLLPPLQDIETAEILKICIEARSAIAELKQAIRLIPNPQVLLRTIPFLEAKASSEIENIVTTTDKLFEFRWNYKNADPSTKEALRYSDAVYRGFEAMQSRPLSTRIAEEICSEILGKETFVRKVPGTALKNQASGEIIYTPPEGEPFLRDLLSNWERFINESNQFDPLIKMAVMHYQFEAIHPFTDGNGRTGRILNTLFLIQSGLISEPVLYLSRYILRNRAKYNRVLMNVTVRKNWNEMIVFFLRGIEETSIWTISKIAAIRRLEDQTIDFVKRKIPRVYSYELINLIFELPYCRIADLTEAGIAKRQTASQYLTKLNEIGVLYEIKRAKEKLFVNARFMNLLTDESNKIVPFD